MAEAWQQTGQVQVGGPHRSEVVQATGQSQSLPGLVQSFRQAEVEQVHIGRRREGSDLQGQVMLSPGNNQRPVEGFLGSLVVVLQAP
jgi:hypothetical protein